MQGFGFLQGYNTLTNKKCVFFVDEPVVIFQRNVFLTLEEEMKVSLTCLSMKYILPYLFQDLCEKTEEVLC